MTRFPKPSGRRSDIPARVYRPTVTATRWRSASGSIPGVLVEIPANRARLFVSADHLRALADDLHDAADELETDERSRA